LVEVFPKTPFVGTGSRAAITFAGDEDVRQGNCDFAGEHCSNSFQGFMEGGATKGARAAQEIISR
jgi:monoamine oxidase